MRLVILGKKLITEWKCLGNLKHLSHLSHPLILSTLFEYV